MWSRWIVTIVLIAGCDQVWGLERPDEVPVAAGTWRSLSAGERHTCGIRVDGTLWCWGADESGQLGFAAVAATTPAQVGTGTWREVSGRGAHACAIDEANQLWCWGENNYGQRGAGSVEPLPAMNQIPGQWEHVDTSHYHTCAIAKDTTLWCWGENTYGQLGDDTIMIRNEPTAVVGTPDHWRSIALGGSHTCGVRDDDTLWCWGLAFYGALADPNLAGAADQHQPHRVLGTWTAVSAGTLHTCAISTERRIRCWGFNSSGELGDGTTSSSSLGVDVGGRANDWIDLATGAEHNCARRESGDLYCWGDNRHGQIPSPDVGEIVSTPVRIAPQVDAWSGAYALGLNHTCAIDVSNRLWCLGGNGSGQLGRGTGSHFQPTRLAGEWLDAATGDNLTCALDSKREAYCWGDSSYSALGDGTQRSRQVPTLIAEPGPWDAVVAGGKAACVKRGTQRWCWGANEYMQLGIPGSAPNLYLPKKIDDGHWPQGMRQHLCSVENGGLWCWGTNLRGELGLGDLGPRALPTQVVNAVATWKLVGTGNNHTCGSSTTGLYCWGRNDFHQVGDGAGVDQAYPKLVANGAVDSLSVGNDGACAVTAGIATCWGLGASGALGNGTFADEPTPHVVPGKWLSVVIANTHACGVATDRSLWCWGENTDGKLGDGTRAPHNVPIQVGTDHDWDRAIPGREHSCALKVDHGLWCWGANPNGELGDATSWSAELQLVD